MRARTVVGLAIVVLAAASFVWFVERERPSTDELAERGDRLLPAAVETGSHLVVSSAAGEATLVDRGDADGWWIEQPLIARADSESVTGLLRQLGGLQPSRTLDSAGRAEFGLEPPQGTIEWLDEAGEAAVLRVGSEVPASQDRFVLWRDVLYTVPGEFFALVARSPRAWRAVQAWTVPESDIVHLAWTPQDGVPLAFERRGEEFWIVRPIEDLADPEAFETLRTAIASLTAEQFVEAEALTAPVTETLQINAADGRAERLDVWRDGSATATFRRADGQLFTAPANFLDDLTRPGDSWRSPRVAVLETHEIYSLSATGAATGSELPLTLERAAGDWRRGDDRIEHATVSALLEAISALRAVGFSARWPPKSESESESESEPGLEPRLESGPEPDPWLELRLSSSDGVADTVTFFRSANSVAVRPSTRNVTLDLPGEAAAILASQLDAIRSAAPLVEP